ncbi:O-acetyl-ADP-ribose deacetylase [Candidatus Desantisbacteria bacterium]|nr:O-acetyl-ADP-ribose deacetylase [Candidatus Desantisbacteria bacterium]
MEKIINQSILSLVEGDITQETTDTIVNAANSGLMGGGGVDGAIHRAGGPKILEECKKIRAQMGRLPAGQAVITTAGNMKARFVIHTVGPIWHGGDRNEPEILAGCYLESLKIAIENGCRSISFPSISTGAYRYPVNLAAPVAINAVVDFLTGKHGNTPLLVRFVLFSSSVFDAYTEAIMSNRCFL